MEHNIDYVFEVDEHFRMILKSARPERPSRGCPPDGLNRILRRHQKRVRSRRKRQAILIAGVVLLIPVLVQTNVISAILKLIQLDGSEEVGRIFKFSEGDLKFNVLGDNSDEEIMEYGQLLLAGEGEVIGAVGFIVKGEPYWIVKQRYNALGGVKEVGRRSRDPATLPTDAYKDFILNDWESYHDRIASGSLKPVGTETVVLDGYSFLMQVWELDHPELGTVKFLLGDIVASEESREDG